MPKTHNAEEKIALTDVVSVKHAMDTQAMEVMTTLGHIEDHSFHNKKLAIGFFAVFLSILGHFFPMPWPDRFPYLAVIIVVYWVLHWGIQYAIYFVEKDIVMFTKPKAITKGTQTLNLGKKIHLRSNIVHYVPEYHVALEFDDSQDNRELKEVMEISKYFTEDGQFLPEPFAKDFEAIYWKFVDAALAKDSKKTK